MAKQTSVSASPTKFLMVSLEKELRRTGKWLEHSVERPLTLGEVNEMFFSANHLLSVPETTQKNRQRRGIQMNCSSLVNEIRKKRKKSAEDVVPMDGVVQAHV